MSTYAERIRPTDYYIRSYLEDLQRKKYQVPTFQREVVWDRNSVKKLWDSIYRFYPIGSILIWKTDLRLQNHRAIGGHVIAHEEQVGGFQYILDGQQRTTSLLTSLYGGRIEGRGDFDPTIYVDLTISDGKDLDEDVHQKRFLFWDEIDDNGGRITRNTPRYRRYQKGLVVRMRDIMLDFGAVERPLAEGEHRDYDDPVRRRLGRIRDVVANYRLSFIELSGIEVAEVCQIFERINQEGQPLDIFDIVVAKTFRLEEDGRPGFYLREMIERFRQDIAGSHFAELDDLTYLQVLAAIIYQFVADSGIYNVTPTYLERIKTEQIEAVWDGTQRALRRLFDFLENRLHLKGPRLVPYRYFYLTLATHFYDNASPNYDFLKQYFWYYSFHNEDLLTNTTQLRQHVNLLHNARTYEARLDRFLIDRNRLRTIGYSTRGRLATAIMALLANHEPRDWKDLDRHVLSDVYYELTDRPNLHHIFPRGFMEQGARSSISVDSMMNLAYLTQITNIKIGAHNPLHYLAQLDKPGFASVLEGHLVPSQLLQWARKEEMPPDAYDRFVEQRIDCFVEELKARLLGVSFDVIDTRAESEANP